MRNAVHNLPVLGICGWSNSGKTTLIEQVIPELGRRGLRVAVVKHDAHGVSLDKPGKDSDRFFQAGADVFLGGPTQDVLRRHRENADPLASTVTALARRYDLVLVEGHKSTPLSKIWLQHPRSRCTAEGLSGVLDKLPFGPGRAERLLAFLDTWLPQQWHKAPLYACVLIGGDSRRAGRPKHLLRVRRRIWLEHVVSRLEHVAARAVLIGHGDVPESLRDMPRIPDIPDAAGPVAGMLAAMRWAPSASWIVTACDLPFLSRAAIEWLVSFRRPGLWAAVPRLLRSAGIEPLLAYYDCRAAHLLQGILDRGGACPADIVDDDKVTTPEPPAALAVAWQNMETQADPASYASFA